MDMHDENEMFEAMCTIMDENTIDINNLPCFRCHHEQLIKEEMLIWQNNQPLHLFSELQMAVTNMFHGLLHLNRSSKKVMVENMDINILMEMRRQCQRVETPHAVNIKTMIANTVTNR